MVAVVAALLSEDARRREERPADATIPFRPDPGRRLLDDQAEAANLGCSAIGRLKGLAMPGGVIAALERLG